MALDNKPGALTVEALLELWKSSTDRSYHQPMIDHGDGLGIEAWGQLFEQIARTSRAVDTTLQAWYIQPHSGQTSEPASGARYATVTLTFTRSKRIHLPLILDGLIKVEEETTDYGENGPVTVLTSRFYQLTETIAFGPGEAGPISVVAQAVAPGYGYNNPQPNTIKRVYQPGSKFYNDLGSVEQIKNVASLRAANKADSPIPDHRGQYLEFIGGSNFGRTVRAIGYRGPAPEGNPPHGGYLEFEPTMVLQGTPGAGVFEVGERVQQAVTLAEGFLRKVSGTGGTTFYTIVRIDGTFDAANVVTGLSSTATMTPNTVLQPATLTPEDDTATWRILDWEDDWGLEVTNELSPSGGKSAMLDALGEERLLVRGAGEGDSPYRDRVHSIADVVSPLAIIRTINRNLGPLGLSGCFREVGTRPLFPGFFFDHDAYDYDFEARPTDRFKMILDYDEFRAFFLVGVPPLNWGEFGFAYDDAGPQNAYDLGGSSANTFYDGFPLKAAELYRTLWTSLNPVKAGGVGFDLYQEKLGCF